MARSRADAKALEVLCRCVVSPSVSVAFSRASLLSLSATLALTSSLAVVHLAAAAPGDSSETKQEQTYKFDIPADALDAALARFEAVTSIKIQRPASTDLHLLASPGVTGVLTAGNALERLLAGTGLTFRTVTPGALELTVAVAPEVVDVTGRLSPYRPIESTGATKTDTPLRDIPQTVTVVPEPLLVDQHAQSVADAVRQRTGRIGRAG